MHVPVGIERVVAELEPGGWVAGVHVLTGGVSANVYAVDVDTSEGPRRRVVCRQHPGVTFKQHGPNVTAQEDRLLRELHRAGLPVPQPYLYVEPPSTAPFLVMEWVEGSTELSGEDLPVAMDEMARFLVDLHALDPSAGSLADLEPIEDPFAAIVPFLPSTDAGRSVERWLASDLAHLYKNRPAVLHGDYWPGNVLWRGARLLAVIDWEDASLGDPLADVATARLELLCRHGAEAMERFTGRYVDLFRSNVGPLSLDTLVIWELYVSASALAGMGDWGLEADEAAHRREHTKRFFERAAQQIDADPAP